MKVVAGETFEVVCLADKCGDVCIEAGALRLERTPRRGIEKQRADEEPSIADEPLADGAAFGHKQPARAQPIVIGEIAILRHSWIVGSADAHNRGRHSVSG